MHGLMTMLYDVIGTRYEEYRRPDPRIRAQILTELSGITRLINVGAGVGSYEPTDREVVAVELSELMISKRSQTAAPVVQARAEALPFKERSFEAATVLLTIHHWSDYAEGLRETRRVITGPIVVFTWFGFPTDEKFWLLDYIPEIQEVDESLFPSVEDLEAVLGPVRVLPVCIPHDCTDGFLCAYWRRPQAYLDAGVRSAISTFSRVRDVDRGLARLKEDLRSGNWHEQYGELLEQESLDFGYRLIVSDSA